MSGPMGVMATKLLLAASALLLSARVDTHEVWATLDPSLPVSRVTPDIARRLKASGPADRPIMLSRGHVVGLDHEEMRLDQIVVVPGQKPDLVIGADVLREMALELDFRGGRLRVIERGALRHRTERMTAVAARISADNCLSLSGAAPNGTPINVALDGSLARPSGTASAIQLGKVRLTAALPAAHRTRCEANDLVLDWSAFAGTMVILDLGNGKIWLPTA